MDSLTPIIDCPPHFELVIYAETPDELTKARRNQIQMHLVTCPDCRFNVQWCRDRLDDGDV